MKVIDTSSNTVTLQWNKHILSDGKHHVEIMYGKSPDPKILSTIDLTFKTKHVEYKICELSPNTSYDFKVVVVHEVGIIGEYTEIKACTGKICMQTYYYNSIRLKQVLLFLNQACAWFLIIASVYKFLYVYVCVCVCVFMCVYVRPRGY